MVNVRLDRITLTHTRISKHINTDYSNRPLVLMSALLYFSRLLFSLLIFFSFLWLFSFVCSFIFFSLRLSAFVCVLILFVVVFARDKHLQAKPLNKFWYWFRSNLAWSILIELRSTYNTRIKIYLYRVHNLSFLPFLGIAWSMRRKKGINW